MTLHIDNLDACAYMYIVALIACIYIIPEIFYTSNFLILFHINNNMHAIDDTYLVSYMIGKYIRIFSFNRIENFRL